MKRSHVLSLFIAIFVIYPWGTQAQSGRWVQLSQDDVAVEQEQSDESSPTEHQAVAHSIKAPNAVSSLLLDAERISHKRVVAVGERGHILFSDDQGKNWTQADVPTQSVLTAVYFVNASKGWAVGHAQVILHTSDGGESWQLQHRSDDLDYPALLDVWFNNEQQGIAVGAYGLVLKTADGGKSWQEHFPATLEDPDFGLPHFYSLYGQGEELWMAGEAGLLAYSADFGDSWQKIESPYEGTFFHISRTQSGSVLAMGLRGHLFRSSDNGQSWQEVETGVVAGLSQALQLRNGRLIVVGLDGKILLSSDDGRTVTVIQRADRKGISAIVQTGENTMLLFGENGVNHLTREDLRSGKTK